MPLGVVRTNSKNIFDSLNPFIEKLVGAYKQKKQNEWDAEWQMEVLNILESDGNQKSLENLLSNIDPPASNMDIEGAKKWATEIVGMMDMVIPNDVGVGRLTPTSTPPPEATGEQPEPMPDKMQWDTAFKVISESAPGQTDWSSLTAMFKKRIESGKAMGAAAQSFLNMIMGQQQPDQREELGKNIDMTNKYMERYPETEEDGIVFDPNQILRDNPNLKITGYNSNTGGYTFGEKEEEGLKMEEIERFNKWLTDSGFVIKGGTINPVTGSQSYNFGPAPEGEKSFDQAIKDAKKWVKENPNMEISNINFTTETVSVGQKSKSGTEAGKTRPNMDKYLFGDTGIINDDIKGNIEGGYPLSEEEIALVLKNHNLRKHTLTDEELAEVELIFEQIGIDPNETKTPDTTLPGGPQSKPKSAITKFGENIKSNVLGLKDLIMGDKEDKDEYGYVLDEIRVVNGKRYQYKGNDEWLPL